MLRATGVIDSNALKVVLRVKGLGAVRDSIDTENTTRCLFCGKDSVKRTAVGIWKCKACKKVLAGGAYSMNTAQAAQVRTLRRHFRPGEDRPVLRILIQSTEAKNR